VTVFKNYLASLRERVRRADGASDLVSAILPDLKQEYGSWGFFDLFATANIRETEQELSGSKRVPQPLPIPSGSK
jgi:hypothetical protein